MSSRPQFSLRMLLLVTVMVCLAAATARSPSLGDVGSPQYVAARIQAYIRLAECLVFPAIFTAWAVANGGLGRTFCLGAVLPAAMPMVVVCFYSSALFQNLFADRRSSVIEGLNFASFASADRITALWVCTVFAGLSCVLVRWFVATGPLASREARHSLLARLAIVAWFVACASAAIVWLPDSSDASAGESVPRQLPVRLILCLVFPALLAAGAVEGEGKLRAFCACALFPAFAPVVLAHAGNALVGSFAGRWEPSILYDWRYFTVAMWTSSLLFGGASVFFHWLFQLGEAKSKGRKDRGDEIPVS